MLIGSRMQWFTILVFACHEMSPGFGLYLL